VGAERRVHYVKQLLDQIGLGGDRVEMFFLSSSEGAHFAEICREMTERIRQLGPNPLGGHGAALPTDTEGGRSE